MKTTFLRLVTRIELKIFCQGVTSASFWSKRVKCWNLEDDCVPNGCTGKVAPGGFLLIHEIWRFQTKCIFFLRNGVYHLYECPRNQPSKCLLSYCVVFEFCYLYHGLFYKAPLFCVRKE